MHLMFSNFKLNPKLKGSNESLVSVMYTYIFDFLIHERLQLKQNSRITIDWNITLSMAPTTDMETIELVQKDISKRKKDEFYHYMIPRSFYDKYFYMNTNTFIGVLKDIVIQIFTDVLETADIEQLLYALDVLQETIAENPHFDLDKINYNVSVKKVLEAVYAKICSPEELKRTINYIASDDFYLKRRL